jgi:hypothetical protein
LKYIDSFIYQPFKLTFESVTGYIHISRMWHRVLIASLIVHSPFLIVVCSSSIYEFWLSLWYLQTLLPPGIWLQTADDSHNSLPFESLLVKVKSSSLIRKYYDNWYLLSDRRHVFYTYSTWISSVICLVLFVFSEVRWEVIVNFVDKEQTTQWPREKSTKGQTTIYKTCI